MKPEHFGDNLLLLDRIGVGGMGEVFRAKQIGTQGFEKVVAVKRILPALSTQQDLTSLFTKEMRITALLRHSNIAQVFNNGTAGDYLYYVMEYVKGTDAWGLSTFTAERDEPFPIDHACFIIAEAAKGLHYAHTLCDEESGLPLGIIHRDITPHNIICSEHGEVKLLDFGIAKISGHVSDKTEPGDIRGSPRYLSPEQMTGEPATVQSDVFALGVILWELLAGQPLFEGETLYTTINNVVHMQIPPIRELRPDVSRDVERIIMDALERAPSRRLNSAEELHRRLSSYLNIDYPNYRAADLGEFVLNATADTTTTRPSVGSSSSRKSSRLNSFVRKRVPSLGYNSRLRRGLRSAIIIVLGVSIGLGYLKWRHDRESRILNSQPIIFSADHAHTTPDQRVTSWEARTKGATFSLDQAEEARMPTLVQNGIADHPVIRFDGVDDILSSAAVAEILADSDGATILSVARLGLDKHGYFLSISQSDLDSNVFRFGTDDSGKPIVKVIEESWVRMLMVATSRYPADFAIITAVVSKDTVRISINGTVALSLPTPKAIPFRKSARLSVGGDFTQKQPSDFVSADVAEIQIISRALDPYSVTMIEEHLSHKYGLTPPTRNK